MSRSLVRQSSLASLRFASRSRPAGHRFASTYAGRARGRAAGAVIRLGLAGAVVYYYNTASLFADEPNYVQQPDVQKDGESHNTIESIAAQRRAQARASSAGDGQRTDSTAAPLTDGSPQQLEEEASQQGAFNEETGEINWDCPCLGGMDGPCGEQFKAAFSCFVFSKEEPKGIDCIEHFKTMQNCFREHPDVYGSELEPDEADEPAEEPQAGVGHAVDVAREHIAETVDKASDNIATDASAVARETTDISAASQEASSEATTKAPPPTPKIASSRSAATNAKPSSTAPPTGSLAGDEGGDLVPRAWHNSTDDGRSK